jgi:hypothetical protein
MWCFYGLNYEVAYACFYDTFMGHYACYIVPCSELSLATSCCGVRVWAVVIAVTQDSAMETVIYTCQAFMHKTDRATNGWTLHQVPYVCGLQSATIQHTVA